MSIPGLDTEGPSGATRLRTAVACHLHAAVEPLSHRPILYGDPVQAASTTTAVASNDLPGSPLIRTIDAGARWSLVQTPPDLNGMWTVIGFPDHDVGYAFWERQGTTYSTSSAQLWRTDDAGATWAPVTELP